jgi:gluconolactonase
MTTMKVAIGCTCVLAASAALALDFTVPVEKLAGGFQFTEGPLWVAAKGELLFSDIPADRIVRFKDGKCETFRTLSHNSDGLTLDKQGRLIACEHGSRRVSRTEADGTITILAERYEGQRLNSPNDVVVKNDGAVYFTDPPFGVKREDRELDFQGVYRIAPDGKTLTVVARDFLKPNGLAFTLDERVLYINDTERGQIRAFDVAADGTLTNSRVFAKAPGADGMKLDAEGNVYCACRDGVMVFDRTGKHLGTFATSDPPTNCAFGDADWRTLFITARPCIYRVRLTTPGVKVP